jgi:trk system potassium uptake protein TrkA
MRRVAVIGLSAFGTALVRELVKERCRVLAVDLDPGRVDLIRDLADEAVIADARDVRALEALHLTDYDAVVLSLGEPLDASLLAVLHLRDLKVRPIYAKAVNEDHRRLLLHLGVEEAIFPEADMATRTAHVLANPGFLDTLQLGTDICMAEVAPRSDVIGRTLGEIELRQRFHVNVVAVRDTLKDETRVNPDPSLRITDSDILIVIGRVEDVDRFVKQAK